MADFKFRNELAAHTGDVRGLCCTKPGVIFSASRDFSVRSWNLDSASANVTEGNVFSNHSNYVTAVIYQSPTDKFPLGIVLTASNDRLIRAFGEDNIEPLFILHGHTDAVCTLDSNSAGLILSGSWDSTVKIWNYDACLETLQRPGTTIWSVLFLPDCSLHPEHIRIAAGCSDSIIAIWLVPKAALHTQNPTSKSKNPSKTLVGHTGCVRSLALVDTDRLLSASNDGSLRLWSLSSCTCMAEFYGHTNFVYSVTVSLQGQFIASSGEDRTVRVWPIPRSDASFQQIECQQTLFLPCQTVWCVSVTLDGDIVVGCSDKKIRIFTRDPKRQAEPAALETYNAELASSQMSIGTLGELDNQNLPSAEALNIPGKSEGQVMMVREDSGIMCYQWSAGEMRWIKVGDVVGSATETASGSNRTLFEGKEYDFVFTVDFDESAPPVKLPFNKIDDPWTVAQAFLYSHDLPQDYLDTVANYIITNAGIEQQPASNIRVSDPFTGGGRYIPGSEFPPLNAGESRQRTRLNPIANIFPASTYLTLESINVKLLATKLSEINYSAPTQLSTRALELICQMTPEMSNADAVELTNCIIQVLPLWPTEKVFPLFDLLRCLVRWPGVSEIIFDQHIWSTLLRVSNLQSLLDACETASSIKPVTLSTASSTCILFLLRLMTNAVAVDASQACADSSPTSITVIVRLIGRLSNLVETSKLDMWDKNHHQVAFATLLYNLTVLSNLHCKTGKLVSVLPALRGLPGLCIRMVIGLLSLTGTSPGAVTRSPSDATLRLLTALGTAIVTAIPDPVAEVATDKLLEGVKMQRMRLIGSAVSPNRNEDELAGWESFRDVLVFWAEAATASPSIRQCAACILKILE